MNEFNVVEAALSYLNARYDENWKPIPLFRQLLRVMQALLKQGPVELNLPLNTGEQIPVIVTECWDDGELIGVLAPGTSPEGLPDDVAAMLSQAQEEGKIVVFQISLHTGTYAIKLDDDGDDE